MKNVIGIDPSLTATGIARPGGSTTTIRTHADGGPARLRNIYDGVLDIIAEHRINELSVDWFPSPAHDAEDIDLAVVEDLPTHGHSAGKLGQAHGVVRLALVVAEVPFVTVPPATLKKFATGSGVATKADMRIELYRRTELDLRDDNQVDAWWLRALGAELLGEPVIDLPKHYRAAITKLGPIWKPEADR